MNSDQTSSNIHFYSERGLVNALVLDLNDCMNNGEKEIIQKFFNSIEMYDINFTKFSDKCKIDWNNCKIDWYIEPNLGAHYGFGSPDLIAKITSNEKHYIFFFEAKLTSFKDNSKPPTCKEGVKIFNHQGSNLNIQLFYKYLFSKALLSKGISRNPTSCKNEIFTSLSYNKSKPQERTYRLQKQELIDLYNKSLFQSVTEKEIFYIALTNEEKKPGDWRKSFDFNDINCEIQLDIENEFCNHIGCLNYNKFIPEYRAILHRLDAFIKEWPDIL